MANAADPSSRLSAIAAFLRIVLGVLALTVLPLAAPRILDNWWVLAAYLVSAIVVQVLVVKNLVPQTPRALTQGLIDYAMLTFVVYRLGSTPNPLTGLYIFVAMLYALTVRPVVAIGLSILGATAYAGVLLAEAAGLLAFAPDAPGWVLSTPPAPMLIASSIVLGYLLPVGGAAVVASLAETLRRREVQLDELSKLDSLTQLYNRRHVVERLEVELARTRRGHPLAVAMIDLDNFKRVNDAQGHPAGDRVLRDLSASLREGVRISDTLGRFGGDEFVVLYPDVDLDQARLASERLLRCIRAAGRAVGAGGPITASVGVALADPGDDPASLLRRADEGTYAAKRAGGDRVVTCT